MRIGLYGGSFNPIHKAHIWIAKYSIKKLKLDKFIFIPCYKSVDKELDDYVDPVHRINMMNLVIFDKCSISRYEIDKLRGVESIETIRYFRNKYLNDELFFIIGSDNLLTIDTWQDYQEFDDLVNLVVFKRGELIKNNSKGLKVVFMDNECWDVSSSAFRESKDFSMLDDKVSKYIKDNGLYNV